MSDTEDAPGTFTHVKGEMAWVLAEHRDPRDAVAMARNLDAADEGRFELLGLVNGCRTAVYWDYIWLDVIEAPFDADDVYDLSENVPTEIGYSGRGEYLAEASLETWDWVHPRHQWLLKRENHPPGE